MVAATAVVAKAGVAKAGVAEEASNCGGITVAAESARRVAHPGIGTVFTPASACSQSKPP